MEGTEIRAIRKVLGLTQEQLARELGVSWASVTNWERGRNKPSPLAAYRLEQIRSRLPKVSQGSNSKEATASK